MGIVLTDQLRHLAQQLVEGSIQWAIERDSFTTTPDNYETAFVDYYPAVAALGNIPNPRDLDGPVHDLEIVVDRLGTRGGSRTGLTDYQPSAQFALAGQVERALAAWSGDAADEFRQKVFDPFNAVYAPNQLVVATFLHKTLLMQQKIWENQADYVLSMIGASLDNVNSRGATTWPAGQGGGDFDVDWVALAGLGVAVVGLVMTIPTGGASDVGVAAAGTALGLPALSTLLPTGGYQGPAVTNMTSPEGALAELQGNVRTYSARQRQAEQAVETLIDDFTRKLGPYVPYLSVGHPLRYADPGARTDHPWTQTDTGWPGN